MQKNILMRSKFIFLIVFFAFPLSISLVVFAEQIPALDPEFACVEKSVATDFVRDFNIDVQSFGGLELCDNSQDTKKLFNDLSIIRNGKFADSKANLLIRNFVPADEYYTWMKSQTNGIARGNDIPFATAYNSGGYFTMQDGWAALSTLGRVGTIIHEARHTQGFIHIRCRVGPYSDSSVAGCDRDYDYAGSHAIEMEYYARVSEQGVNFHPVYQSMARMMAMARANFVFNQSPIQKKTHLLAITEENQTFLLTEQNLIERSTLAKTPLKLKRTSAGANVFSGFEFFALDLYRRVTASLQIHDDFSYYKLFKQNLGQDPLVSIADFEEIDLGPKRYFVYLNKQQKMTSYLFPQGKWGKLIQAPILGDFVNTLPDGSEGLYLRKQQELFQVHPGSLATEKKLSATWPQGIRQFAKTSVGLFSLQENGTLLSLPDSAPIPGLAGHKILMMTAVPSYDAFEVQ